MAHKTISDEELMTRALELFRTYGFEGVSLKQLADAMGLEKASLYYRFPGGKDEIVLAVVRTVDAAMHELLFAPLAASDTSPRRRVQVVCERLREFYACGTKSCTMDLMSIPGAPPGVKEVVRGSMQAWLDAFAGVARESGLTTAQARTRSEEAIFRIEGALIVSRVMGDGASFERVMKTLPDFLTVA